MVVLVVTAVNWTMGVTNAITDGTTKQYEEKCTSDLMKIVDRVRGELTSLQRKTLGALVVMDVHARDVVANLAKKGVSPRLISTGRRSFVVTGRMIRAGSARTPPSCAS